MKIPNMQKKMTITILLWFMILTAMMLLTNCEENPNPIALKDRDSEIVIDTLYAIQDTTYALNKVITTLNSERLLLGSQDNFTFRIILRFSLLDKPDTLEIDNAWIRFVTLEASGEMPTEFTATGYPAVDSWIADTSKIWEGYPTNVDYRQPLGEMLVTTERSDTVNFQFNNLGLQTVRAWADTSDSSNNGIVIDFASANFVKEFQARVSLENLGVFLFIADSVETDSGRIALVDSFLAITDAYLVEGQFQPVPQRNYTSTLKPWVTLLKFNLDTLKQIYQSGLVVTSANLQLPVDWDNTLAHPDFGPRLQLFPLTSALDDSSIAIDSTFIGIASLTIDLNQYADDSTYVEITAGGERQEFSANYIQRKINFPDIYTGLYIENRIQDQYLANFSFYKYNFTDPKRRPRLIIQSLKFPDERL